MKNFLEKLGSLEGKQVVFRFKNWGYVYEGTLIKINNIFDTLIIKGQFSKEEYFRLSSLDGFYEAVGNKV